MSYFQNKLRICDGCICHILEEPDIFIDKNLFHNNICCQHYKYIKKNKNDFNQYKQTGRNYFVDVIEFNIDRQQIRDATLSFLVSYIKMFFEL
jgi:hypothetical protein